jgi:hypothetical protein
MGESADIGDIGFGWMIRWTGWMGLVAWSDG